MKIYARGNEKCTVIHLFSTIFENPLDTDILVEEGNEDYHAHVYLKYQLIDDKGFYNYKLVDCVMVARTEEEKQIDNSIIPKSQDGKKQVEIDGLQDTVIELASTVFLIKGV